jgi:hypothetical protein
MRRILSSFIFSCLVIVASSAVAWPTDDGPSAEPDAQSIEDMIQNAAEDVTPTIRNWFERAVVAAIYQMRDDPRYRTFSYIAIPGVGLMKVCDSIGYGLDAGSLPENPVALFERSQPRRPATFVPRAAPNGLFPSHPKQATYLLCVDRDAEAVSVLPVYSQSDVTITPFRLDDLAARPDGS